MSGGVGPTCNDISLPKDEEDEKHPQTNRNSVPKKGGFFSFRQLNMVAVVIILSASGMVCLEDFLFVIFSAIYMYFMSKVAFPNQTPKIDTVSIFGRNSKFLGIYVLISTIIGLLIPIAYIFEGIFEGDKEGIKAAAPHVYLLASQVFMEGLAVSGDFSIPIRVLVPAFYNARRIFTIYEWVRTEIYKVDEEYGGSPRRLYVGRALAVANMAFWCFNLFGFLLPLYLPRAFKLYYSAQKHIKDC